MTRVENSHAMSLSSDHLFIQNISVCCTLEQA